jgi:hypothetical protein
MKRIITALIVMTMMMASAMPAFAASDNASCVGQLAAGQNSLRPGSGGFAISYLARNGLVSDFAQADNENCPGVLIPPR